MKLVAAILSMQLLCGYSGGVDTDVVVKSYIPAFGCISCVGTLINHCRALEKMACKSRIYVIAERPREARKMIRSLSQKGFDVQYYSADSTSCIKPSTYPWVLVEYKADTLYIGPITVKLTSLINGAISRANR